MEVLLEPSLRNRVSATIPRIHGYSKLPWKPVLCEQVHCIEAAGVWLKYINM